VSQGLVYQNILPWGTSFHHSLWCRSYLCWCKYLGVILKICARARPNSWTFGNWDKSYKSFSPVFGVMCSGDLLNPFFNASIYACSALPLLDKKIQSGIKPTTSRSAWSKFTKFLNNATSKLSVSVPYKLLKNIL
jgi:hypothetical protein